MCSPAARNLRSRFKKFFWFRSRAGPQKNIGIYLPDESLGVRIEDDIVVKKNGYKNLSKAIPKTVVEIEEAMKS